MNNLPSSEEVLKLPSFVISLKRNEARFLHTKKILNKAGFQSVYPFEAVDAVAARDSEDEWDQRIRPLGEFLGLPWKKNEDGSWMKGGAGGPFGTTLSVLTLWGWLSLSNKNGLMIFEDDALPRPDFLEVFPKYWDSIELEDVDMVYLGGQTHPDDKDQYGSENGLHLHCAVQCMHAYYITKKGAKKILDFMPVMGDLRRRHINKFGSPRFCPIDTTICEINKKNGILHLCDEVRAGHHKDKIPDFKCVSFLGNEIPVKGKYDGTPWEGRNDGIIHQNADLGSNIHGLQVSRMRKEEETEKEGHDVFHESIMKIDEETGKGYIEQ